MRDTATAWRQCSSCRKPIAFEAAYYACSVSSCNRGRTALYFCSLPCWEAHLPMMRHRDAWAEEQTAPSHEAWEEEQAREQLGETESHAAEAPARRLVSSVASSTAKMEPDDVLVVVSKIKKYVRARSGMNTSDGIVEPISDHLRRLCDEAIRNAARDGRKTVLDRDFAPILRLKDSGQRSGRE
jgi:histone H3/H4